MTSNCKNCGADRGLHHYETMQCPVGGREAPIGRKQEWMRTEFEIDESEKDSELDALRAELARVTGERDEAVKACGIAAKHIIETHNGVTPSLDGEVVVEILDNAVLRTVQP